VSRPRALLALAAPLAALAAGCGGSGRGNFQASPYDGSSAPRLAKAELVSRANAICARRTRALAELPKPAGRAASPLFFARVAKLERTEFLALTALRPPRADEQGYVRLLAASLALARVSDRFYEAVVARDAHARRRALADVDRISEAYDRAARRLGLACRQTV
jgi:hypothetical protein